MTTHFEQRCIDRISVSMDADDLFKLIIAEVSADQSDIVEHVMDDPERASRFYRVMIEGEDVFYAVVGMNDARPRTLLTQSMMRSKKWGIRKCKKGQVQGFMPSKKKGKGRGARLNFATITIYTILTRQ